jgi:exonuclease III
MSEEDRNIRVLQYNILADGLSRDGFVCSDSLDTIDGEVRTVPEFLAELQNVKGDVEEMRNLAMRYDTEKNNSVYEDCLDWSNRWPLILELIETQDPDILVFQEMDRYAEVLDDLEKLGYVTTFKSTDTEYNYRAMPYSPMWANPNADTDSYLHLLNEQGFAFIPKLFSKARKFALKRGVTNPDNDGCAIFWKKRFSLKRLEFCQFYEYNSDTRDEDGAIAVVLHDWQTDDEFCVITSHLPSGQTRERELERLELLSDTERGVFRKFIMRMMSEVDRVIVALDANSDPLETYDSECECYSECDSECDIASNVWQAFHNISKLKGVWDIYFHTNARQRPITVNKIRGPKSNQPQKIGIHSYELIDHIFYSGGTLRFEGFVTPVMAFSSKEEGLNHLIPNRIQASDHYPVIADFSIE